MSEVNDAQVNDVIDTPSVETQEAPQVTEQTSENNTENEVTESGQEHVEAPEKKISDEEAAKIREATERKVKRKYEAEIAEYKRKMSEMAVPPDNESVYDDVIGWRPKNMSIDEYRQRAQEVQAQQAVRQEQMQYLTSVEQRAAEAKSKYRDFETTIYTAANIGAITPAMALAAGQEDGALEVLYELAKVNSPKLLEIARLPEALQQKEVWKLSWAKRAPVVPKQSNADEPLKPENARELGAMDEKDLDFRAGYEAFKKRRR